MISQAACDVLRLRLDLDQQLGPGLEPAEIWISEFHRCTEALSAVDEGGAKAYRDAVVRLAAVALGLAEAIDWELLHATPDPIRD